MLIPTSVRWQSAYPNQQPPFPRLRSGHQLFQRPSPQKQIPSIHSAGDPAPFYHPYYRDDDLDQKATTQKDWQARQDLWSISDNPYRYYRW